VILMVDPSYFTELTSKPIGWVLMGVAGLMLLTGMLVVRRLVKIRY
jgi:Flp pilus assembly protein TadB